MNTSAPPGRPRTHRPPLAPGRSHLAPWRSRLFLGLQVSLCAWACGTDKPIAGPEGADDTPKDSGALANAAHCEAPQFTLGGELVDFESLVGRVVDPDGNGAPNTVAQACGTNLCLASETDDEGRVIPIGGPERLADVRFKYGDGKRFAQFALVLPEQADHDVGSQLTFALPPAKADALLSPGVVTSSDIALTIEKETSVQYDLLTRQADRRFAAAGLYEGPFPEAVASAGLELLLYLGPGHTELCPPAGLSVPNEPEWPAQTEVEFLFHNTDVFSEWAAYGSTEVVSDGQVSADGKRIETAPGQGIPVLGAIGIRRK